MKILITSDLTESPIDQERFKEIIQKHDVKYICYEKELDYENLNRVKIENILKIFGINKLWKIHREKSDLIIVAPYNFYLTPILKLLGHNIIYFYGDKITKSRCDDMNISNPFMRKIKLHIIHYIRRLGQIFSILSSDCVIVLDTYMKKDCKKYNKKVFVCDGRVNTHLFNQDNFQTFRKYSFQVLFSGQYQGFFEGISEFCKIVSQCKDIHFILAGQIPDKIKSIIKNYSNLDYYEKIPYNLMPSLYCSCDVSLDLYRDKTITGSQTINEALSCGIPVVGFQHNQTILVDGYNSLLFDNMNDIVKCLRILSKNNLPLIGLKYNSRKSILPFCVRKHYLRLGNILKGDKK